MNIKRTTHKDHIEVTVTSIYADTVTVIRADGHKPFIRLDTIPERKSGTYRWEEYGRAIARAARIARELKE